MSYKILMWTIAAVVLVGAVTAYDLTSERSEGAVFIDSKGPISEQQVREKMQADGWSNVLITSEGRYFQVMGTKDQQTRRLVVDSQTGRLRGDDDD